MQPDKRPKSPMSGEPLRAKDLIPLSLMADPEWTVRRLSCGFGLACAVLCVVGWVAGMGGDCAVRACMHACMVGWNFGAGRTGRHRFWSSFLSPIEKACLPALPNQSINQSINQSPPPLPTHPPTHLILHADNDHPGCARRAGQVPLRRLAQGHHHAASRPHQEVSEGVACVYLACGHSRHVPRTRRR